MNVHGSLLCNLLLELENFLQEVVLFDYVGDEDVVICLQQQEFMHPSIQTIAKILGTPTKQRVSTHGTIVNVSNTCVVVVVV